MAPGARSGGAPSVPWAPVAPRLAIWPNAVVYRSSAIGSPVRKGKFSCSPCSRGTDWFARNRQFGAPSSPMRSCLPCPVAKRILGSISSCAGQVNQWLMVRPRSIWLTCGTPLDPLIAGDNGAVRPGLLRVRAMRTNGESDARTTASCCWLQTPPCLATRSSWSQSIEQRTRTRRISERSRLTPNAVQSTITRTASSEHTHRYACWCHY